MDPQIDLRPENRYVLPHTLREAVAGNFGTLLQTPAVADHVRDAPVLAAVGDVVSKTLHDLGIAPRLFVCDYQTQRSGADPDFEATLGAWGNQESRVKNPAGTITRQAWTAIRDGFESDGTTRIVVDGEEDLLGIPCFLEIPTGGMVLYGAPDRGLVAVTVDAAFKELVADIVGRMTAE